MYGFHDWADANPGRPALTLADSGVQHSAGALAQRSRTLAQWLAAQGLREGETIAILMENRAEILELALAAQLAGLYYTVISTHLTPVEVEYILGDSGARHVFVSSATAAQLAATPPGVRACHAVDMVAGLPLLADALGDFLRAHPDGMYADLPTRAVGRDLLYSSGTTGRPKGIRKPLDPASSRGQPESVLLSLFGGLLGFGPDTVYLSPAPLYHAAPLRYCLATLSLGGAVVIMPRFDAALALALIERWRVTHSQWVPTMFARLLQLPDAVRRQHDLSSHRYAIHAAAPCPVPLKQAMLDWWGDILYEYYAGSEASGITFITPQQWRAHPGSVGPAISGRIHILDEDGRELPPGQVGQVYFSDVPLFEYLNDPEKTRQAINARGWATYGDQGQVDEEGYLYLSDRRADLILSGGVNLYPREMEDALVQHAAVQEVAVVGVPDSDFGECAIACIVLQPGWAASRETAQDIAAIQARVGLARIKHVRRICFVDDLPRLPTGKLLRRVLKEQLRQQPGAGFAIRADA